MVMPKAPGQRESRRELDAVAAVALAHRNFVHERARLTSMYVDTQVLPMQWFSVERCFDATPINVTFGKLHPLLAPVARFWWRDKSLKRHAREALAIQPGH